MDRVLFYVTNRTRLGDGYGPPPAPPPFDALAWGRAPVAPSADPAVSGRISNPLIGTDAERAIDGAPPAALITHIGDYLRAAAAAGCTPLIYVHGYNYTFAEAVTRTADVAAWYAAGPARTDVMPLLFTWPSTGGAVTPDTYTGDRACVLSSGMAYARFFLALQSAWAAAGRPKLIYLAHSMGAHMSNCGLFALAGSRAAHPEPMFAQSVVIAGDEDTNAFDQGQGLATLSDWSRWVTIGVNRQDGVVRLDADLILRRPRLGLDGPDHPDALAANVRVVDYSMAVAMAHLDVPSNDTSLNYVGHQYYRTVPRVRDDLAQVFADTVPDTVAGRITSAQLAAGGDNTVTEGRLYVLPPAPMLNTLASLAGG